jgi:hypothetical protein
VTVKSAIASQSPRNAAQRSSRAVVGDRRSVAEGVRTALVPDPHHAQHRTQGPLLNPLEGRAAS